MRINLGSIGKLGDESTRLKVLDLAKDNPVLLEQYEWFVANMADDNTHNMKANLEITLFEPETEPNIKLIPKKAAQKVTFEIWDKYTPYENKLELVDGEALWGDEQRDKMLLMLVYNTGLEHFIKLLPEESKTILKELL